jgi:MFS family permease
MTMLNKWFTRRRSSAIGWANVVSRFGALLLVPAIAWAVADSSGRIGWQTTALIIGIGIAVLALPLASLIRNDPKDYGEVPDGRTPRPVGATGGSSRSGQVRQNELTASEALRTPAFWLIAFGHGFTSMVILAIMTHLGLLMVDNGYSGQDAGWVVSVYTGVAMVFQLVGGYAGDRMSKRVALAFFTSLQAAGVLVLVVANTLPMFYLFGMLFGAGFGGRNPLTVAIRADYFGTGSFGKILGFSTVPMNLLLLIASPFAGWMYDQYGSYNMAFLILAGLNLVGAVCFLAAARPRPGRPQVVQAVPAIK